MGNSSLFFDQLAKFLLFAFILPQTIHLHYCFFSFSLPDKVPQRLFFMPRDTSAEKFF